MGSGLIVLLIAAILSAVAATWVLRAYRRGGEGAPKPAPALIACAVGALASLGLYLAIGRPDLPDQPYRARLEALRNRDPASLSLEEWLAVLHEAARIYPNDPGPDLLTGKFLLEADRAEEAARAYDEALRRDPRSGEAMMGLGRSMVAMQSGRVSPDALRMFQGAAAATPSDPAPWLYQAMAAMQAGDEAGKRHAWGEALARMAPDDPRRAMAAQMSQRQ
ncbi:MAG: tetratricopeptide repeat protein [Pseudomonadota bacterium]